MSATTPQQLTTAIRAHHRSLANALTGYTAQIEHTADHLDPQALTRLLGDVVNFLDEDLLPHARGEERALYPALDPIIRERGKPTATMSVDHEYLANYAQRISQTARTLATAPESERPPLIRLLQREIIQMEGLFAAHLEKEERIYLPLIEEAVSAGAQEALLAALHDDAPSSYDDEKAR